MQAETRENSLEIWKLQRQSSVLTKSIGEDVPVAKIVEQQTQDLVERNEKLSQDILAGINGVGDLMIACCCFHVWLYAEQSHCNHCRNEMPILLIVYNTTKNAATNLLKVVNVTDLFQPVNKLQQTCQFHHQQVC